MPYDLTVQLAPAESALLVFECQQGVIGEQSYLPGLAAAARSGNIVENIRLLLGAARSVGTGVFHCILEKRADGVGDPINTPLQLRLRASQPGSATGMEMGEIVPRLAPHEGDVVVSRAHGMTGFYQSGLDATLRKTDVRTIVLTGVSVNIGILGTAIEAVNRGYTVVVPRDCVAGDPPEYAEQALRYSIRNLAFLSSRAEIAAIWARSA